MWTRAQAYDFTVDASAITPFAATPAHVSSGFQGSSRPNTTDITWSGPSGFDSITLIVGNSTEGSQDQYSLPGTATSFMPPTPLTNGDSYVRLEYIKDVTGQITSDTPTNGLHGPLSNWDGVVEAQESVIDQVTFTVAPEPASLGACCIAGLGWLLAAGRRVRRA